MLDTIHIGHVIWGLGLGQLAAKMEGPASWGLIAAILALGMFGMVLDYWRR
jgi:F0F1-type ATP synthase assembly protein I